MKVTCVCGHQISDGGDALPQKAHIISDQDWHVFLDEVDSLAGRHSGPAISNGSLGMELRALLARVGRFVWQCSNCSTLHIDDKSQQPHVFTPEKPLRSKSLFDQRGSRRAVSVKRL